jgi:hypothetical protein
LDLSSMTIIFMSNHSSEKEENAIHKLNCIHAMSLAEAIAGMQSFSCESVTFFIQISLWRTPSV